MVDSTKLPLQLEFEFEFEVEVLLLDTYLSHKGGVERRGGGGITALKHLSGT